MFRESLSFLLGLAILGYFVVKKAYERLKNMSYYVFLVRNMFVMSHIMSCARNMFVWTCLNLSHNLDNLVE